MMDGDGGNDAVGLGVDDGDAVGLGVDDVDLIAGRVHGEAGGIVADAEGAVLAKIDEVEHRDGVRAAVADVGELVVSGGDIGETVAAAAGTGGKQRESGGSGEKAGWEQKMTGGWHCCESIEEVEVEQVV
ncbi:hypothetical protein GCM10011585_24710 [Edaphobacter dinghuensis]|uniref:Uncharacterized protein n=1 Tax=Edaphobacter dinghuensis TaxID=1560005 RepID=A0A917M6F9_9BACT|nr:hypothetical protein GCM10011585_24710 [Edaphobacter dinghuensis]